MRARSKASASSGQPSSWAASAGASKDSLQVPCRRLLAFQLADPCTPCFLGGVNETACAVMRPYTSRCASGNVRKISTPNIRPWLVANTRCRATACNAICKDASRILALQGRSIVLARLLRRTECMAQMVPQSKALTAAPKHCTNPRYQTGVPRPRPSPWHENDAADECASKACISSGSQNRSCTRKRS